MKKTKRKAKKKVMKEHVKPPTWVDKVYFPPNESPTAFSVVSWNVLAEAYCSRRSQRCLPPEYQRVVFSKKRRQLILDLLDQMDADIFLLQEVDLDEIGKHLSQAGYEGIETPRTKGGSPGGRTDACGTYVKASRWTVLEHEIVSLDDLATLTVDGQNHDTLGNLQGLQQSFLRRKMALLTRLECKVTQKTVVVVNAHLYWNPGFEYVKLCQAHYILERAKKFHREGEPLIFSGDLNSRPQGVTYAYLSRGSIDAKHIAPWYTWSTDEEVGDISEEELIEKRLEHLRIENETPVVKYLLDVSLNKLCRYLRILGLDVALETDEEEKERTGKQNMVLFERCRQERRVLVTTSKRLTERKDCPSGTYFISPQVLPHFETCMIHMLLTHGVVLEPKKFLGVCVVCNGNIVDVQDPDDKRKIIEAYQAPPELSETEVYQCNNKACGQGYWWSEVPTSSASRVKSTATRLFEKCVRAGIPVSGDLALFDGMDIDALRKKGWDFDEPASYLLRQKLLVVEWLGTDNLKCPQILSSVYANDNGDGDSSIGERITFTNVTVDFVNVLDYIFYDAAKLKVCGRLYVPTTFKEMNTNGIRNGHLVPSDVWPSDHLAIGAVFDIVDETSREYAQESNSQSIDPSLFCAPVGAAGPPNTDPDRPQVHTPRCDCGCVPPVLSLFEMAELRKKARMQKASNTQ